MGKLITAWDTRTGKERRVPEHWFDHEDLSANLTKTDPKIPQVAPEGVNQAPGPDARDYATAEEVAAAAAAKGELKGKDLDAALERAGLPKTGSADEKRAALAALGELDSQLADAGLSIDGTPAEKTQLLAEYQAEQAEIAAAALANGEPPTDSNTGDTNPAQGAEK